MVLELRQQLKLTQQLVMTPQLQMAIRLLQLSRLELVDTIRQELEENPALEEIHEDSRQDDTVRAGGEPAEENVPEDLRPKEVKIDERIPDDVDWAAYMDGYNAPGKTSFETEEKESPRYEAFVTKQESLSDHLLWQLLMTSPTEEEEHIGSLIIGNLNAHGFLDVPIEHIIQMAKACPDKVMAVLSNLQTFDPVGVCARDFQESLLIQARYLGCDTPIVVEIIRNHLKNLENKNYKAIAKALKTELEPILEAITIIKGLEPMPGRQYSDETHHYITPDIFVYKIDNEFVIVLNDDGMPKLRVNSYYQNAMKNGRLATDSARDYMQEKMRSAAWLIKSIQQRQKTIYRVMESILKFQREFFDRGVAYLRPMILKDVADDIEMHESTISRVTTNKYVYTPQGTHELKYFFNSSINRVQGDAIASASVQEKIRRIIESENPQRPYSDEKIAELLQASNIDIARRTVAKYREMMKILPSSKRKQY